MKSGSNGSKTWPAFERSLLHLSVREEVRQPAEPAFAHATTHRRLQAVLRRLRQGILHPVQAGVAQEEAHWYVPIRYFDIPHMGGSIAQWLVFALPDPGALGSISGIHDFFLRKLIFREKLSVLPRLINGAVAWSS